MGGQLPGPLRSEVYPDGLPHLTSRDAQRVDMDNKGLQLRLGRDSEVAGPGWGQRA